jgi:hypothetical protein
MAVSYISSSSNKSTTTSVTVTAPSNIQDGDILVAFISAFRATNATTGDITVPEGFTKIEQQITSTRYKCAMFWKRANSESGNYTFGSASATQMQAAIGVYRGSAAEYSVIDQFSNTAYIVNNNTVRAASITPDIDNGFYVYGGWYYLSGAIEFTAPSGMNSRQTQLNNNCALNLSDLGYTTAEASGVKDGTAGANCTVKHAILIALRPEPEVMNSVSANLENATQAIASDTDVHLEVQGGMFNSPQTFLSNTDVLIDTAGNISNTGQTVISNLQHEGIEISVSSSLVNEVQLSAIESNVITQATGNLANASQEALSVITVTNRLLTDLANGNQSIASSTGVTIGCSTVLINEAQQFRSTVGEEQENNAQITLSNSTQQLAAETNVSISSQSGLGNNQQSISISVGEEPANNAQAVLGNSNQLFSSNTKVKLETQSTIINQLQQVDLENKVVLESSFSTHNNPNTLTAYVSHISSVSSTIENIGQSVFIKTDFIKRRIPKIFVNDKEVFCVMVKREKVCQINIKNLVIYRNTQ